MIRETQTETGLVRGIPAADPRITVFRGIPFAAPPVGENRWRAPQSASPWEGVRDCARFAPISMQETPGTGGGLYDKEWHVDPDIPMDEDCLYLNVWTPARTVEERLPVMVWIFGGGMTCGYPAEMEFDGERLARRGVVLVSVNYRLNAFGFLAHPELTKEADEGYATNFGLLDQRAGIAWVKRNIENFGGDPENITVFGQSAGGRSTLMQTVSPMNRGLFQRAIVQSGALDAGIARYPDLSAAEAAGEAFLSVLGVKTIAEARALPARVVLDKALHGCTHRWGPVIDGCYLPGTPAEMFAAHLENNVDMMAGCTPDEVKGLRPVRDWTQFREKMEPVYGPWFGRLDSLTHVHSPEELDAFYHSVGFNTFEIGNHYIAQKRMEQGKKTYLYRFCPVIPGDDAGVFHSSYLWFMFETLAKCWRPFRGEHYDLARRMCTYWANFARTGNPNGLDNDGQPLPCWDPTEADQWKIMRLNEAPVTLAEAMDPLLSLEMERLDAASQRFVGQDTP